MLARRFSLQKTTNDPVLAYKKTLINYKNIPTTVFTPLEFSTCGLNEQESIKLKGEENIEVY
jgi:pyruvate/2-oxoglutarate dehydrogenase complex dihydrolipoamide dehydrogenase (E3) component